MPDAAPDNSKPRDTSIPVRVRYVECDPMNVAHHSAYPVWLEMARTQLLRERGTAYRDLETRGILFVVARLSLRYHRSARYDDELDIHVRMEPSAGVKIEHSYEVRRGAERLATGQSTIVCVDREGKLQAIPDDLLA